MEGNALDVFRVLSLVVVWGIPAILILAVVVFVLLAPAATLVGAVLRLYDVAREKLQRRRRAEAELPIATQPQGGEVAERRAPEKEPVGARR